MAAGSRLHLHTDGLHQHHGGGSSSFNEADYAAVTPTAARPHPEQQQGAGLSLSLYDAFIPPQYAYYPQHRFNEASSMAGVEAGSASPFPVFHGRGSYQQEHQQGVVSSTYMDNNNNAHVEYAPPTAPSSCSSSSENSYSSSSDASSTAPSSRSQHPSSSMNSPAFSSNGVPGNTIYNSNTYTTAYHPQFNQNALSIAYSDVANQPAFLHDGQVNHHHQDVHQQAASGIAYNHVSQSHQLAYPPYQPGFYNNNQFAIYNGNNDVVNPPSLTHHAGPTSISPPISAQISPNMAYNNVSMNDGSISMNGLPSALSSINVDAFTSAGLTTNHVLNMEHHQPYTGGMPASHTYRHAHSASLSSSVSSTNSLSGGGSPAPSLSGSDDSGNTSKSTLSKLSIASKGHGRARSTTSSHSHSHSRRGSVSSVVSHAGTPYALSKKDSISSNGSEKKFVCSYPGCTRSFSRNFNLSTHYNTHLGIKPFPCTHCPKSFSRRHDCARHIAAVHASESDQASHHSQENAVANLSPTSCGCGHTCPAHKITSEGMYDTTIQNVGNISAFSLIKGEQAVEDDVSSTASSSASSFASGYDSTLSSIDSFIGQFGGTNFEPTMNNNLNLGMPDYTEATHQQNGSNGRSPSLFSFSNISGYIDVGRIKIEDGEGE